MMKRLIKILLFYSIFYLISCSSSENLQETKAEIKKPEEMYTVALKEFENQNYELAIEKFKEIELIFPLSNESIQSQIMIAFIEYIKLDYDLAIIKLEKIIRSYPSYKDIDYVYYMKAMCYYERVENPELDGRFNVLALKNFKELINYFPGSKYARDSQQKIILLNDNVAAKHMNIGLFYLNQKKYLAALKRYQKIIDNHSESKYAPEALHRLVEIYYSLGMIEDAKKAAAVLGYNYPKSKWYEYSYNLVGDQDLNKANKSNFFKKILNKISSNNED